MPARTCPCGSRASLSRSHSRKSSRHSEATSTSPGASLFFVSNAALRRRRRGLLSGLPLFCKSKGEGGGVGERETRGQREHLQVRETPAVWRTGSIRWTLEDGRELRKVTGEEAASEESSRARTLFTSLFLPSDYPASVSPDYAPWLQYHLASLFTRDVLEVLASQSLLVAVSQSSSLPAVAAASLSSLGPNTSATMAAATKWVLKDGFGSLATLAVGSRGGQSFDEDPKRWWVVTSAMEDVARLIEICLPLLPIALQAKWFLPGAGMATFVRSGALVGRNSLVNGTLIKHFGEGRDNLSDIRAKLEAQGRILKLASLPVGITLFRWTQGLGLTGGQGEHEQGLGLGLGSFASSHFSPAGLVLSLAVYSFIFGIHNFCCYRAAKSLSFTNLSAFRTVIVAKQFLQDSVQSPEQVALVEGVYTPRQSTAEEGATIVGCSFKRFHDQSSIGLQRLESTFASEGYVLTVSCSNTREEEREKWDCLVLLKTSYTDTDIMKAVLQAQIIISTRSSSLSKDLDAEKVIQDSLAEADSKLGDFQRALVEAEWNLKVVRGAWNTVSIASSN